MKNIVTYYSNETIILNERVKIKHERKSSKLNEDKISNGI